MKRIALILACMTPMAVLARADSCSTPNDPAQFTIDKRCYATAAQKETIPFSVSVALNAGPGTVPFCSGTIIKKGDTLYLYTAKHCVDSNKNNIAKRTVLFKLPDGRQLSATYDTVGQYNHTTDTQFDGDYAIYKLDQQTSVPYTTLSTENGYFGTQAIDARLIGYGALRVMSDHDITQFKEKYMNFLQSKDQPNTIGSDKYGGIVLRNSYVQSFINSLRKNEKEYYADLFRDTQNMKISVCKYHSTGAYKNCQNWGGNSGGGVFDPQGKLMGIHTRGKYVIGGPNHGSATYSIPVAFPGQSNISAPAWGININNK